MHASSSTTGGVRGAAVARLAREQSGARGVREQAAAVLVVELRPGRAGRKVEVLEPVLEPLVPVSLHLHSPAEVHCVGVGCTQGRVHGGLRLIRSGGSFTVCSTMLSPPFQPCQSLQTFLAGLWPNLKCPPAPHRTRSTQTWVWTVYSSPACIWTSCKQLCALQEPSSA